MFSVNNTNTTSYTHTFNRDIAGDKGEESVLTDEYRDGNSVQEISHNKKDNGDPASIKESLIKNSESLCVRLDALNGELLASLRPEELSETESMLTTVDNLLKAGANIELSTRPGSAEHQLASHLRRKIRQNPDADIYERGRLMMEYLGGLMNNDDNVNTDDAKRHLANVISVTARTGTIVVIATLARQLIGFFLETHYRSLGESISWPLRIVAGVVSLTLGPALNIAGAVRDEINGTATSISRTSRVAMGVFSAAVLLATLSYRPAFTIGSLMGSFGIQTLVYTLLRDLMQLFFPLRDNGGLNARGLAYSSLMYGAAQALLGFAFTQFAPQSGAGYAMEETDRLTKQMAGWAPAAGLATAAIQPNLVDDLLRSALNGLTEVFDDLQRPTIMRWYGKNQDKLRPKRVNAVSSHSEGVRIGMECPRVGPGRWPTFNQIAEQFLTTNAMRTSYFIGIVGISLIAAAALDSTALSDSEKLVTVNAIIVGLVVIGYPAFIAVHAKPSVAIAEKSTK